MARKKITEEKRLENDVIRIILFLAALVVLYFIASYFFKSLNQFDYEGLSFTKKKFDQATVYHYYYYYTNAAGQLIQYNLYLHNDPRTNNVTISGDPLLLNKKYLYMTFDDSFPEYCRFTSSSIVDLSLFFKQNEFTVFSGVRNESVAHNTSRSHYQCETLPDSAEVLEFYGGNQTEIVIDGNCHKIFIGPDCSIRDAVERVKLQVVIEARARNL